jgi:cysteine rich repeat protein
MSKLCLTVAAIVIGFSGIAQAQTLTAEERTACQADYDKYCKGTMAGGGRIIACLNKNPISEGCKKVLAAKKN